MFELAVFQPIIDEKDTVLIITGIPGAGKSSFIGQEEILNFDEYKFIFEGSLDDYEKAKNRIDMCLKAGLEVEIYVFHRKPEKALENTYKRFNEHGRGAYIGTMARIQGGLAKTIPRLIKEYKGKVLICAIDLDKELFQEHGHNMNEACGNAAIPIITKEGNTNDIDNRLTEKLKRDFENDSIGVGCLRQAAGDRISEFTKAQALHAEPVSGERKAERSRNAKACSTDSMVNPKEEHISQLVLPIDISFLPFLNTLNALDAYVTEYEAKAECGSPLEIDLDICCHLMREMENIGGKLANANETLSI